MDHAVATTYFDLLPLELIPHIVERLGDDLAAHVFFGQLSPRIWKLCYENRGRDFWERLLRTSGLSEAHDEARSVDDKAWEKMAVECALHAADCKYPMCGMARLRENSELMKRCIEHGMDVMAAQVSIKDWQSDTRSSSVWNTLQFKRSREITSGRFLWNPRVYLKDHTLSDIKVAAHDKLSDHPIMWKTFATFPPVTRMVIQNGPHTGIISNPSGLVVADVLQRLVDNPEKRAQMDLNHIRGFISEFEKNHDARSDAHPLVPTTWTLQDIMDVFLLDIDWFRIVRLADLEFAGPLGDVAMTKWQFGSQPLPADYQEFKRLTTAPNPRFED